MTELLIRSKRLLLPAVLAIVLLASACAAGTSPTANPSPLKVVAVESFLADIAQNVAGDRVKVDILIPPGSDPHGFQATPQDVRKIAESDVLIVNGVGFEAFLGKLLENAGRQHRLVEAARGLAGRTLKANEPHNADNPMDPHFWFDPTMVISYVENIRAGLTEADPAGAAVYQTNADAYVVDLKALDEEIKRRVSAIPEADRMLVTDHDTFGYFADRYGFRVVGMIAPSFSTADATTAQGLAELIDTIRATHAKAIFLETSANPQLAEQISAETGARVVTGLYTHGLSEPGGPAPTYIKMLEYDTQKIVDALK